MLKLLALFLLQQYLLLPISVISCDNVAIDQPNCSDPCSCDSVVKQVEYGSNAIYNVLYELETSLIDGSRLEYLDSDIGRAAIQARDITIQLKSQLQKKAPLFNLLLDAMVEFSGLDSFELDDPDEICNFDCYKNILNYYYANRPNDSSLASDYPSTHRLGHLKADEVLAQLASTSPSEITGDSDSNHSKQSSRLTLELLDGAYEEYSSFVKTRTVSRRFDLAKYLAAEREIAYRSHQGARILSRMKPIYMNHYNHRAFNGDFVAYFQGELLSYLDWMGYKFKDGRVVPLNEQQSTRVNRL